MVEPKIEGNFKISHGNGRSQSHSNVNRSLGLEVGVGRLQQFSPKNTQRDKGKCPSGTTEVKLIWGNPSSGQ